MRNVQISVDDDTLQSVDRVAGPLGLSRSEVVRQALRQWLRQRAVEAFERDWIAAAEQKPDDTGAADVWLSAQAWSRR